MLPDANDLERADGHNVVQHLNGFFYLQKKTVIVGHQQTIGISLTPLYWNYVLNNSYLKKGFPLASDLISKYELSTSNNGIPIENKLGEFL